VEVVAGVMIVILIDEITIMIVEVLVGAIVEGFVEVTVDVHRKKKYIFFSIYYLLFIYSLQIAIAIT